MWDQTQAEASQSAPRRGHHHHHRGGVWDCVSHDVGGCHLWLHLCSYYRPVPCGTLGSDQWACEDRRKRAVWQLNGLRAFISNRNNHYRPEESFWVGLMVHCYFLIFFFQKEKKKKKDVSVKKDSIPGKKFMLRFFLKYHSWNRDDNLCSVPEKLWQYSMWGRLSTEKGKIHLFQGTLPCIKLPLQGSRNTNTRASIPGSFVVHWKTAQFWVPGKKLAILPNGHWVLL